MTDEDRSLADAPAIAEELFRVLSNEPATGSSGELQPVLACLAGRPDALAFLRTVPTGTSLIELERLGAIYCAAKPFPPRNK
jgi:hypothetical protein